MVEMAQLLRDMHLVAHNSVSLQGDDYRFIPSPFHFK